MVQGLGLKNAHPVDDLASSSDVRIAKDNSGPVYEFMETERAFIVTANLKGYRKEHVEIDTSEDGTRISIGLEKPVQENVMSGTSMKKKKVFRIPDGVDLRRIKAKFNELESTLRIDMPKLEKGVVGVRVEEVKEEEADKTDGEEEVKEEEADKTDGEEEVKEEGADTETPQITQAASDEVPGKDGEKVKGGTDIGTPQITQAASDEVPEKDGEKMKVGGKSTPEMKPAATEKSNPLRTPLIIVGSALLVSVVLLAINRIRNRKKR